MAKIIEMPKLGFDMAEGTLMNWLKAEGDQIEKGELLAEIETDKATVQVESSASGIIYKQLAAANTTLPIGAPIAVIAEPGEQVDLDALLGGQQPPSAAKSSQSIPAPSEPVDSAGTPASTTVLPSGGKFKASPLAKAMAREKGIDLPSLTGSGPGGRIVKRDVENALQPGGALHSQAVILPGQDRRVPLSKLRAAIGRRMQDSIREIPAFYVTRSFNVADLLKMRRQMNEDTPAENKISVNDLVVRAAALALRQFPNLNASLAEKEIVQHGNINIGSAVSLEGGLLTVVIRNADQKSIRQIAAESADLFQRAHAGRLRNEDVEGSTFTISNLGMYGVEDFVAIINPPEAAILAVGAAQEVPVAGDGQVQTGWLLEATLSADHRITDGAEAAQFMQHLAQYLEQPWRLVP